MPDRHTLPDNLHPQQAPSGASAALAQRSIGVCVDRRKTGWGTRSPYRISVPRELEYRAYRENPGRCRGEDRWNAGYLFDDVRVYYISQITGIGLFPPPQRYAFLLSDALRLGSAIQVEAKHPDSRRTRYRRRCRPS